ncbi:MAG: hypothetical protein JO307_24670 [Bryobacterales bacterium]|nr:hypothetical protein [Bryobacterales bacterium]MBV9396848.1 hypothetical protein [Bryobacterales bacterium]
MSIGPSGAPVLEKTAGAPGSKITFGAGAGAVGDSAGIRNGARKILGRSGEAAGFISCTGGGSGRDKGKGNVNGSRAMGSVSVYIRGISNKTPVAMICADADAKTAPILFEAGSPIRMDCSNMPE